MPQLAVVDKELCRPTKCGHECEKACPVNRNGEPCIVIGKFSVIDESLCIGCHLCVRPCPFHAITIINLPEHLAEEPVHRYGQNEFALFRLPYPVKGVVGLLGPNGVGKTTAMRILSGQLEPSIGLEEIKKSYKGTDLQSYLEMLSSGVSAVYKPQDVSSIPKFVKKAVCDIIDDSSIIRQLSLNNCLDRLTTELSGGELQRLAIAQALSRDADVYYFDEPSAYLDVRHRLVVARVIRSLAEKKHVMVIEHDLATLDYLADRIHIFYGSPGAYGVVSKPYSASVGINAFLRGFLKEDNMRIRDATVFEEITSEKKSVGRPLVMIPELRKSFGSFSFAAAAGEIRESEVLGIIGSNALGKTTFAKLLASGEVGRSVRISYKPQYLSSDYKGTVGEFLFIPDNLRQALDLGRIWEKPVSVLSGGELQRVAIAECLSRDADVYLLDEPSAYLDIDQRLSLARLLRNRTALVIDHDLLFISYIADRLLLFSGSPSVRGDASFFSLKDGMNSFLAELGMTFRRDPETKRIRSNKPGSQLDNEQKEKGEYFYAR